MKTEHPLRDGVGRTASTRARQVAASGSVCLGCGGSMGLLLASGATVGTVTPALDMGVPDTIAIPDATARTGVSRTITTIR